MCVDRVAPDKSQCLATSTHLSIGNLKHERQGVFLMQEIWKDVPNYEGLYQVSNLGRVRSNHNTRYHKPKILKSIPRSGYVSVILCKNKYHKNVFIHRLVAECFVPNPQNKPCVNHIDGNKANPCATNLEWCTQKENISHAIKTGLLNPRKPKRTNSKKLYNPIYQFDIDGNFIKKWNSCGDICDYYGIKDSHIYDCISGKCHSAYGYVWSKTPDITVVKKSKISKNKHNRQKRRHINQYDLNGVFISSFPSQTEAAIKVGVKQPAISLCCNGKTKTSGGYIWKYAEGE